MPDKMFFIDKNNEWEPFAEGVQRKIIGYDDNIMMVRVKFATDATVPLHHHPHVQCSLIESGKFEVIMDNTAMILTAGDGFFVPSGISHKVNCLSEGVIIDTFHPAREDFIKK
jgi:quercetin dioxygenase-like cupin family protein